MAVPFNDTEGQQAPTNNLWLHRSQGNSQTDALKELFGGAANAVNNGLQSYDASQREQIALEASKGTNAIAESLIPNDQGTATPSDPQAGAVAASVTSAVSDLKAAREQGAMNDVEYNTRMLALSKQMISQHPQYEDVVRSALTTASGTSQANDLRRAKLQQIATDATRGADSLKEQRSFENANGDYLGNPTFQAFYKKQTGRDFDASFNSQNDYAAERAGVAAMKAQEHTMAMTKAQGELDSTSAIEYKRMRITQDSAQIFNSGFNMFNDLMNKFKEASADGKISPEEKQQLAPLLNQLRATAVSKALSDIDDPNEPQFTKYMDGGTRDALLKVVTDQVDNIDKMINDSNIDGLKALQNENTYITDSTKNNLYKKYPATAILNTYKDMGIPPDIMASILKKQRLSGGTVEQELSDALTAGLISGKETWDSGSNLMNSDPNKPVKNQDVVMMNSLKSISNTLSDSSLDNGGKIAIAKNLFRPENNSILTSYKSDDRMAVFKMLVNPAVIEGLKSDPQALRGATNWANAQWGAITKQARDQLLSSRQTSEVGNVTFDGQHFQYTNDPGKYMSVYGKGGPIGGVFSMLEHADNAGTVKAIGMMNSYIDAMQPLWKEQGTDTKHMLQVAFGTNFNDVPKTGSVYSHMMNAMGEYLHGAINAATQGGLGVAKTPKPAPDDTIGRTSIDTATFLQKHSDKSMDSFTKMEPHFSSNLADFFKSMPPEIAAGMGIFSGYRSTEHQRELWNQALIKYGSPEIARRWVAPPGSSNHNKGLAADLSWQGKSLANAPGWVVNWVHQHAKDYDLNFPLSNENWHIEPIGIRRTS